MSVCKGFGAWRRVSALMLVSVYSVMSLLWSRKQLLNAQVIGGMHSQCLTVVANRFILPAVALFFFFLESLQSLSLKEIVFGRSKQAFSKMAL